MFTIPVAFKGSMSGIRALTDIPVDINHNGICHAIHDFPHVCGCDCLADEVCK